MKTDKFTLFLYCNFLALLSTTVCIQSINKQIVNIADENLTDYSFLSRYHYTKSKNYLKRRYWIRHWIPMFIGTPYTILHAYPFLFQNCLFVFNLSSIKLQHMNELSKPWTHRKCLKRIEYLLAKWFYSTPLQKVHTNNETRKLIFIIFFRKN